MTMLGYAQIIAALLCFLVLFHRRRGRRDPLLTDWPILGMLPQVLCNLGQIHDYATQVLKRHMCTGNFTGPWFTNLNYVVTCDPMNIHHAMSKNFGNYVKGSDFYEIFEAFGDGIFNADAETWKYNRTLLHSLFKHGNFEMFLEKIIQKKVKSCLLPLLDNVQRQGTEVDLQDIFNRFNFDNICSLVLGSDPNCLAIDFPEVACERAFNEAEEHIFYRHTMPKSIWKLQKWLQIGAEKKMAAACKIFDQFLYECITSKRKELNKFSKNGMEEARADLLTALMREEEGKEQVDDKFLSDSAFNLFIAGRDTITSALTWFFWLVATHPSVEAQILKEIKDNIVAKEENVMILGVEEVKNLVYLHGAICEALRLFPPIPFEIKQAIKSDVLPSGHHIDANAKIIFSLYTMGRLEEIWGKNCLEFRPERWISERGRIVHVPSYKFISFNAGPRTCLGKDLSFIQMKIVATAILWNYHIQVVEDHPVSPALSIILLMKHGLKVRMTKRG